MLETPTPQVVSSRDPCVVATDGLATVVEAFVTDYERRFPTGNEVGARTATRDEYGHFSGRAVDAHAGALAALAQRTVDADPSRVGVPAGTIRKVVLRRYRTTELRTADAIVTAAAAVQAFYDGTLEIMPNPRAPLEIRAQCCGGCGDSLTGSL